MCEANETIKFHCNFEKTLMATNEKYGDLLFVVKPYRQADELNGLLSNDAVVFAVGKIPDYPRGIPLYLEGTIDQSEENELPRLKVILCKEDAKDDDMMVTFLASRSFPGVGPVTARKIVDTCGKDLFQKAVNGGLADVLKDVPGIREDQVHTVANVLESIMGLSEFFAFLVGKGGTCRQANSFYKKYGRTSLQVVKSNPFKLMYADVPFIICDRIDNTQKGDINSPARLKALIREEFRVARGYGNSYLTVKRLLYNTNRRSTYSRSPGGMINQFRLMSVLMQCDRDYVFLDETRIDKKTGGNIQECHIYPRDIYNAEKDAAVQIARIMASAPRTEIKDDKITSMEENLGIKYSERQREAFSLLNGTGVAVLTGGPGTGKTTVERGLVDYFLSEHPDSHIALCAPTAAAAKRIRETTGFEATTIHKLLDVRPDGYGGYLCKDEYNQLEQNLIVLDECSMVDIFLFDMLLKAVKDGALVLLVGDMNQLGAIGVGNIMHDIIISGRISSVGLTSVYRQDSRSTIALNGTAILEGEYRNIVFDEQCSRKLYYTTDEMEEAAIGYMQRYYSMADPSKTKLFCTARSPKYNVGTTNMNRLLHRVFNPDIEETKKLVYGDNAFSPGDPVVFTKNNYNMGYFNGDEGVVKDIVQKSGHSRGVLIVSEDKEIEVSGNALADIALNYATTVHKAQGNECDTAIILLPFEPSMLLTKDILYVAATRARKRNIFILQAKACESNNDFENAVLVNTMQTAINGKKTTERLSGFVDRLEENVGKAEK